MSISSTSSFNPYAATSDIRAATSRQLRSDDNESKATQRSSVKPAQDNVRPQRLERALMSALKGMGFSADTTATTEPPVAIDTGLPGTGTPASDSTSKVDPSSLKQAVHAFAHELAQALSGGGGGERSGRAHYASLSQKLANLSEKVSGEDATPVQPIKVAPADAPNGDVPIIFVASPASSDMKDAPIKAGPGQIPVQSTPATDPPILVTPETDAAATAAANGASATTKGDTLLSAFTELYDKLQSQSGATSTKVDHAAKLKEFLGSLSQSFSPREQMPISTPGGLLNLSA